jgi:hypothetical protein
VRDGVTLQLPNSVNGLVGVEHAPLKLFAKIERASEELGRGIEAGAGDAVWR